ncbi:hypothetical protein SEA_BING_21 [Streptomyces phage Bing]|uniref:Uncharacterized protein n=1 Tax=Streptomyces phage Bing TaxID=2079427 RepID=A0A2L1IWF4_9CAUD|nr:hypothetical protein FDJ31_gp21 [Streptomyces phage Bing]AVD99443.1 hypothetical protein SEA_BING_21 [Streptomyces phage Bing]
MATVTVVNAERTLEIEATSIVSGLVNEAGHLILTRHDGTDLDMGAVSGMQLDGGTSYSKVDAFTYVGDTDPGAVPDGSVWLDTTDVAGPFASDTQKGLVELATNAETISGTDNTRAVTPASLAAVPGNKVQILAANALTETATPTAYPLGISQMTLTTGSGWSINTGFGSVITYRTETDRTVQHMFSNPGGSGTPRMWQRHYHTSSNGGGWTAWSQAQLQFTLTPGTLIQTTAPSSYPTGWSRMYFSTANGTGWDFAGTAGELLTYVDGTDFARQTWTSHASGSTFIPETWTRTYKQSAGWSAWRKAMYDHGAWISYTPTWTSQGSAQPSFGNASLRCKYSKVGRTVTVFFWINFGSTTNFGASPTASDNWIFSLPVPAANDTDDGLGTLEMYKGATDYGLARVKMYTTTAFKLGIGPGSTAAIGGDVDSISPFVWASGNYLRGTFTYESAA